MLGNLKSADGVLVRRLPFSAGSARSLTEKKVGRQQEKGKDKKIPVAKRYRAELTGTQVRGDQPSSLLLRRLIAAKPSRPDPKRSMVVGSGIGATGSTDATMTTKSVKSLSDP